MIISIQDFFKLRNSLPIVDVRSEGEFEAGHIINAGNIPLLNNSERVAVGTDYKQKGQQEAIKTGFRLVGPRLMEIIDAAEAAAIDNELIVHCWRGGMRSLNFCHFVGMAGIKTNQLKGGYKAYRNEVLESISKPFQFIVIGGCTGSGKTDILQALKIAGEQVIDLEGLAHHKGSSFGGLMQAPQPTTEQFENNLFEEIIKLDVSKRIWIEDESIAIGKVFLPQPLWKTLRISPIVEIVLDRSLRVKRLVNEYGNANQDEFLHSMERITKKLGGQNFKLAKENLLNGNMDTVIDILLTCYYDKAYRNGLENNKQRIQCSLTWDGADAQKIARELITLI
jgi:tRNA 2-selenouridine synthase